MDEDKTRMRERLGNSTLLSRLSMTLFRLTGSAVCMAEVTHIPPAELMQRIQTNRAGLILDVRSTKEYAEGHIPDAINIPYGQLSSRLAEIGPYKDKDIVLYCQIGKRAMIAANILQSAGFGKLLHLAGDMDAWTASGNLPVSR